MGAILNHLRGCKVCRETVGSSVWNIAKVREDIETTMAARKNIWDFNLESKPKPKKYNFELCRLNSSKVKFKSCDIGQHLSLFSLNLCLMRYLNFHSMSITSSPLKNLTFNLTELFLYILFCHYSTISKSFNFFNLP